MQQLKQQSQNNSQHPSSRPSSLSQDISFLIRGKESANDSNVPQRNIADLPSSTLHKSQDYLFIAALCEITIADLIRDELHGLTLKAKSSFPEKTGTSEVSITKQQILQDNQALKQKTGFQAVLRAFHLEKQFNPAILASIICRICYGDKSFAFSNAPFLRFKRYKNFLFALSEVFDELEIENPKIYSPETLQETIRVDFSAKQTPKTQLKNQLAIIYDKKFIKEAAKTLEDYVKSNKAIEILANSIKKPQKDRIDFAIKQVKNGCEKKKITRYKTRKRTTPDLKSFVACEDPEQIFNGDILQQGVLGRSEIYYAICSFALFNTLEEKEDGYGIVKSVKKTQADKLNLTLDYNNIPKGQKQILTSKNKIRIVELQSDELKNLEELKESSIWRDFLAKKINEVSLTYIFTSLIPKKTFASLRFKERSEHIFNIAQIFSCQNTKKICEFRIPLASLAIILENSYSNDEPGEKLQQLLETISDEAIAKPICSLLNSQKANEAEIREILTSSSKKAAQKKLEEVVRQPKAKAKKSKTTRYKGLQSKKQKHRDLIDNKKVLQEAQLTQLKAKLGKSEQLVQNLQKAFDNAVKTANVEIRKLEDSQKNLEGCLDQASQDRDYFREKSLKLEKKLNSTAKNQTIIYGLKQENKAKDKKITILQQRILQKQQKALRNQQKIQQRLRDRQISSVLSNALSQLTINTQKREIEQLKQIKKSSRPNLLQRIIHKSEDLSLLTALRRKKS